MPFTFLAKPLLGSQGHDAVLRWEYACSECGATVTEIEPFHGSVERPRPSEMRELHEAWHKDLTSVILEQ